MSNWYKKNSWLKCYCKTKNPLSYIEKDKNILLFIKWKVEES
jgi:hypothetical protein